MAVPAEPTQPDVIPGLAMLGGSRSEVVLRAMDHSGEPLLDSSSAARN
jgi:hypothetical protein